ncbi:MAG: OB-fold nucleic acid binding domain-containing protein, partial [Anaerolineae bacterium]
PEARPTPAAIVQATSTLSATPTLTSTGATSIGSIEASRIGQAVTARGQVISTASFSAGFRFTLNDGTGSIQLVLFDGRYREVADRAALNLGAQVAVAATVVEFDGKLELQPESGGDVIIEQPGSSSIVKTRAINTLSSADIGTLTAIVGDVLRVEGFSSGVSVFVNDGTGELRVVIFNNVLNYAPNAPSLQAGAKVRVAGRIDEFNGVLELVPALGYDVTINP